MVHNSSNNNNDDDNDNDNNNSNNDDDDGDGDGDDDNDDDDDDVVVRKPTFLSLTDHHSALESARNLASVLKHHSSGQDHLGFSQPVITMLQS